MPPSTAPRQLARTAQNPPRKAARPLAAAVLGAIAALLVCSCGGSSSGGLIPAASAGPLKNDFEAVAQAAKSGNGNCTPTQEAIVKAEQDFLALPSTVDPGLRETLSKGLANLSSRARALCSEPLSSPTTATSSATTSSSTSSASSTPSSSTSSTSTSTTTSSLNTPTSSTTSTATAVTPPPGGGVQAPGEAGGVQGNGKGNGEGDGGAGGAGAGNGNGNGNGNGGNK